MIIGIPVGDIAQPESVVQFASLVKGVVEGIAQAAILTGIPLPPPLFSTGIKFRMENGHGNGFEEFCLPWTTYKRGFGDCDDLVIYRIAELRAAGERAGCNTQWRGSELHVRVRRGDGSIEDPSLIMRKKNQ